MTALDEHHTTDDDPVARSAPLDALGRMLGLRADRQFKAGFNLVTSSAIGAVFGLVFWMVAARGFDEATVGVNAALISTMMLVAGFAGLGLPTSLVRFIPAFGERAGRLVIGAYVVAGSVTAVLAIAVGYGVGSFYEELSQLRTFGGLFGFTLACVAWQIFALQDSVLVGIDESRAVPVENTAFSIAKLVLLVAAIALGAGSIFSSWVAPLAIIIPAVNVLINRRLRPIAPPADDPDAIGVPPLDDVLPPVDRNAIDDPAVVELAEDGRLGFPELIRFSIGEHASALIWMGAVGILPLVVLGRLGDEANAFYAMSWAIAYNLMLISANIGTAFIAEAANEPAELPAQRTAAMRQAALLVVPGALVVAVLAPLFLQIFGGSYAAEASSVLRLLALASIAHVPVAITMATLRAERQVRTLLVLAASEIGLVAFFTALLIGELGVTGVALAWLLAEMLLAVLVLYWEPVGVFAELGRPVVDAVNGTYQRHTTRLGVLGVAAEAVAITLIGLSDIPTEVLTDIGLVSVVGPSTLVAGLVVVATAVVAIGRREFDERWAAAHVTLVVIMLAAAPSFAYQSVRYPWAYKHIGIVDFILRHGGVDRNIDVLNVYHNWPSFFAGFATLTDLSGLDSAIPFAKWAPTSFNLLVLLALAFTLRQLTSSRRVVWLACLLFFVSNWIGQDYFAPQALALVLYLTIIGLVLRFYRRDRSAEPTLLIHAVFLLAVVALVSSHQLTPFFLAAALVGLAVIGETSYRPAMAVGAALLGWLALGATPFVLRNLEPYVDTIGLPSENATQSFGLATQRSDGQIVVAYAGRMVLVLLAGVASIGALRALRRPRRDLTPFALAVAPLPGLFLAFGGEILFRVVLFALPMMALFAAEALLAIAPGKMRNLAMGAVIAAALVPFTFAYYGKDSFYTFTDDEVALVRDLSKAAPSGSLLVEGTRNYPAQFVDYEKFVYVPIALEPTETIEQLVDAPADELNEWMSAGIFTDAYVLLTDGQRAEAEAVGSLPPTFLSDLEEALRTDDRFVVWQENDAGVVFTLAGGR